MGFLKYLGRFYMACLDYWLPPGPPRVQVYWPAKRKIRRRDEPTINLNAPKLFDYERLPVAQREIVIPKRRYRVDEKVAKTEKKDGKSAEQGKKAEKVNSK